MGAPGSAAAGGGAGVGQLGEEAEEEEAEAEEKEKEEEQGQQGQQEQQEEERGYLVKGQRASNMASSRSSSMMSDTRGVTRCLSGEAPRCVAARPVAALRPC